MNKLLKLHTPPKRILIISMRFLGDLLLTTPLIHSIRQAYPKAEISVLVYKNTAAILEGNHDITHIITTPQQPTFSDYTQLFIQIFRKFDLAISTQTGDRPIFYSIFSASLRIAFVPKRNNKGWWKRYLFQGWAEFNVQGNHTILELLKLATLINVPSSFLVIPPNNPKPHKIFDALNLPNRYAVLHIHPQWQYKRWTREGWIKIADYLNSLSITPVLSGSPAPEELTYINSIEKYFPDNTINIAGQVTLAELTNVISKSQLFIGPDTGITHLAAATGTPVIALYGPTNPLIWGPWPFNYQKNKNPYQKTGNQHINNIYLLQGTSPNNCVPCQEEGCEKHRGSYSNCLDSLNLKHVINAIQQTTQL